MARTLDDNPAGASGAASPGAWVAVAVSMLAMAILPFAVTGANIAFGDIEATFAGTSRSTLSWALSGYSIVIAAFTLLGGQLAGRVGARRMFVGGLVGFGAASLVAGLAPNAGVLILGRALQGAAGAMIVPSSLAVALALWPASRRPMVVGVWSASFPIGSSVAPTLSALVIDVASWRWIFLTIAAIAVVVIVLALRLPLPAEHATGSPGRPDLLGVVVGTAAVGLAALGIVQGPRWGWTDGLTLGVLAAAVAMTPLFVRSCRRHPRPLVALRLFEVPTFALASVVNIAISMVGMSVWLLWPLLMSGAWGYDQLHVGLAITPTPVLGGTLSILAGRWAERAGYRRLLWPGAALLVAANLWFLLRLDTDADYWGAMFPGLVLFGIAMGLTFAPLNGAALVDLQAADVNQANAAFNTGRFLSGAIGIAAVVAALGDGTGTDPMAGFDRAFGLLTGVSLVAAVVLLVFWPRPGRTLAP
jgi:EmrB/QacA subfamily drug resistance transporter